MLQFSNLPAAGSYGTSGLSAWIQSNIVGLGILIVGAVVIMSARKGDMGKAITIVGALIIGIGVLGLAVGNNATDMGSFIVSLFKG